jgi:uncharacterized protein YdeI (YjbR/CyaY-like superfamily)
MNTNIETYFANLKQWKPELEMLHNIVLDCGLVEEFKWRGPCYTYNDSNCIIIGGFKDSFVISFLKGVFLRDDHKLLQKPGDNSQTARIIRFTEASQVLELEHIIKTYLYEAIEVEKAGLKLDRADKPTLEYIPEFEKIMSENAEFKAAFEALTPGRKRAYNMHFASAKQSETRTSRIISNMPRIFKGKGLNDCICGLSKRMPNCDGSHKILKVY